jgi:hypothetical protein
MGRCEVLSRAQKVQHTTALGVLISWGSHTPFLTTKNFELSYGASVTMVPKAEKGKTGPRLLRCLFHDR